MAVLRSGLEQWDMFELLKSRAACFAADTKNIPKICIIVHQCYRKHKHQVEMSRSTIDKLPREGEGNSGQSRARIPGCPQFDISTSSAQPQSLKSNEIGKTELQFDIRAILASQNMSQFCKL